MKKLLLITALTIHANAAIAEGLSDEMNIAPDVIVSSATAGSVDTSFIVPLMGLIMLCAIICGPSGSLIDT